MKIEGVSREFRLKADSIEEWVSWVTEIRKHIDMANKKNTNKELLYINNFWKKWDKVRAEAFLHDADTGDILLFKNLPEEKDHAKHSIESEFDFVRMIYKFDEK